MFDNANYNAYQGKRPPSRQTREHLALSHFPPVPCPVTAAFGFLWRDYASSAMIHFNETSSRTCKIEGISRRAPLRVHPRVPQQRHANLPHAKLPRHRPLQLHGFNERAKIMLSTNSSSSEWLSCVSTHSPRHKETYLRGHAKRPDLASIPNLVLD